MFTCEYSRSFRDSFFRIISVATYELSLVLEKNFLKKEVSGEIAFALINLFQVQIQDPAGSSTTTTAFLFPERFAEFYYHKMFEARSP